MEYAKELAIAVIDQAQQDCHPLKKDVVFDKNTIVRVHWWSRWCNCGDRDQMCGTYCDTGSGTIVELHDGHFVYAYEESDTSGHGCQCSGHVELFDSLADLIACGLTNSNRERIVAEMEAAR